MLIDVEPKQKKEWICNLRFAASKIGNRKRYDELRAKNVFEMHLKSESVEMANNVK